MKIALTQMNQAWEAPDANRELCRILVQQAADQQADWIIFPEMTLTGFTMRPEVFSEPSDDDSETNMPSASDMEQLSGSIPTIISFVWFSRVPLSFGITRFIHSLTARKHGITAVEPRFRLRSIRYPGLLYPASFAMISDSRRFSRLPLGQQPSSSSLRAGRKAGFHTGICFYRQEPLKISAT